MPEPGSFEDLEQNVPPDVKHRYTQWRAMQRQRDLSPTRDPEVLRKRGEESRALISMFARPGSNDANLFEMMGESETDTQAESEHPFGKEFGSRYASPEAADQRKSAAQQFITRHRAALAQRSSLPSPQPVSQSYTDLNSRPVGFSERTFMPPEGALANAAKRKLEKNRGQRR